MVAAMIYGRQILPPPPYFGYFPQPSTGMFLMALAIHYSLALIYLRLLSTLHL